MAWSANKHVISDLDWTLLYPISAEEAKVEPQNVIEFKGEHFRFADLALTFVTMLHLRGYEFSLFSAGAKERNQLAAAWITQKMHEAGFVSFKVKYVANRDALYETGREGRMPERYKKDLTRVGPEIDLNQTIMIEDIASFSMKGQRNNTLWLQETYNDLLSFEEAKHKGNSYDAPDQRRWLIERNKLAWCIGVFLKAEEIMERNKLTFVEAVVRVTQRKGRRISRNSMGQTKLLVDGLRYLESSDRHQMFYGKTLPIRNSCAFVEGEVLNYK